jgi:hypothetical protein
MPGDGKFTRRREEKDRANQVNQQNDQWQDYPSRASGTAGIIPTNLASWVTSVLQHGEKGTKLVQCMESKIFLDIRDEIGRRTGLDIAWIVAAVVVLKSARTVIPAVFQKTLRGIQKQVTSSITLGQNDGDIQNGLLRFICNSNAGTNGSWLSLSGRHEEHGPDGELRPLAEDMKQVFW